MIRRTVLLATLVFGLVGCDHLTKHAAKAELESGGARSVIDDVVQLRYAENRDIAFNLLDWIPESTRAVLLLVVGALAIVGLSLLLFKERNGPRWRVIALAVILAGAVGNYADRVLRGYVVDFLHVTHWPVFNVADVYITVGFALLFLLDRRARRLARPSG